MKNKLRKYIPCRCDAYAFPHRPKAGKCKGEPSPELHTWCDEFDARRHM